MMSSLSTTEIQRRILLDFPKNYSQILTEIKEIMPNVTDEQIAFWERTKVLEYVVINGEKRYFRRAARNVFRIEPEAKAFYIAHYGDEKAGRASFLADYLPQIVERRDEREFEFRFTLTVKPDVVPAGETIRCWLPQPIECKYQSFTPVICDTEAKTPSIHSSLYLEKKAVKATPTRFETSFRFKSKSFFYPTDANIQESFSHRDLTEQTPHIVFTERIKRLSSQIVGNEVDKQRIARKIFSWISDNIVWAVAREYSTIANIPEYVIEHRYGDCGQVTLLFMTLCRYNGIPARWLSGFMLHPKYENLHDWCEIFIDSLGWVPVDVSFGIQRYSHDETIKFFYFMGIDAFRLVVNRGIAGEFLPPKLHPRSETVDFQRGEVEWRGGNIYFDKFDYDFDVTIING